MVAGPRCIVSPVVRAAWTSFTFLCLAACSGPTQLIVSVDTDYDVPGEIDAIELRVTGPSGTTRSATEALQGASDLPQTLTVVPSGDALGPVEVVAIGTKDGAEVARQRAVVTLESGRSLSIRLFLGRACAGVSCDASETCRCGACVAPTAMGRDWSGEPMGGDPCAEPMDAGTRDGGDPDDGGVRDAGDAGGCQSDGECDDGHACTTDRCDAGSCVYTPDDAACTDGTGGVCVEGFGCQYDGCSPTTCVAGPCETARCDGDTCVLEPLCGDGEQCCGGACVPTGCDDGNPCTDDACGAAGCENTPNTAVCDDGVFCNGPDTCAAGACTVHDGDPCSGASVCDETMGGCVGCVTDADCPSDVTGPWGSCSYGDTCAETGSRTRTITRYACSSGVCMPSSMMETGSCTRSTAGDTCGSTTFGSWGSCGGFADACDESGTRTRTRTDRVCGGGTCNAVDSPDTGSCARSTTGDRCASTTYGGWGSCGGYSDTCDETGTRSRSQTEFFCNAGACNPVMGTDTGSCTRSTTGVTCGTTTYGSWGSCGGFSDTCDETGTRTRSETTYACAGGTCQSSTGTDTGSCTRSTTGVMCAATTYGSWSSCGGFSDSCDETGTRSRTETTYACAGGTCAGTSGTDTGSCTRNTDGDSCFSPGLCGPAVCDSGRCLGMSCPPGQVCCGFDGCYEFACP